MKRLARSTAKAGRRLDARRRRVLQGVFVLSGASVAARSRWAGLAPVAYGGALAANESPGAGAVAGAETPPFVSQDPSAGGATEASIEVQSAGLRLATDGESYLLHADLQVSLNPTLAEAIAKGIALYFVLECEILRPRWYWTDERIVARERTYRLALHALTRQYRLQLAPGSTTLGQPPTASATQGLAGAPGQATSANSGQGSWFGWIWGAAGPGGSTVGAAPGGAAASGAGLGSSTGGASLLVQSYASLREALGALGRIRGFRMVDAGRLQPGQAYELRLRMRLDAAMLPRPFQVPGIAQRDWSVESSWKRFSFEIETRKSAP